MEFPLPNLKTVPPLLLAGVLGAFVLQAGAQEFPQKPIHIFTTEPGGGSDFTARIVAQGLSVSLGQPVIVENRGGSGVIAAMAVVKAAPDGYNLLLFGSTIWLLPFLQDDVPYDPVRDLAPITLTNRAPNILVVHPSLPVKNVRELVALAKARPHEMNYSSGPTGSSNHLGAELLKSLGHVDIVRVPYKGTALALNALIGGEVQLMFGTAAAVTPHLKSGRLRALAVTTAKPSALMPDLPAIAATLPGYESVAQSGVFAPTGTPPALINRLNREIVQLLSRAEIKLRFFNSGTEAIGSTPEEFATAVKTEMASMGKVIREARAREGRTP
jgi:tripartite-type tricarboxylate transporter receptor subunit TctC